MTQKQITSLTAEQEALIPIIRDEWIRIGLDTTPTDKQKAEEAIALAYECAGLKPPSQIWWFNNPLDAALCIDSPECAENAVTDTGFAFADFGDEIQNLVRDSVNNVAVNAVKNYVAESVKKVVAELVEYFIRNVVNEPVRSSIEQAVEEDFNDWRPFDFFQPILDVIWGSLDVEWLAFYAYFDAIGVDCSQLKGLWETAKHCGCWWAFENVAVVTPKPSKIRLDIGGRLHGLGVPAVAYEGFNVYAYYGVRLPEKYGAVHPEQWQAQWLLEEENAELKRVLIQGIGYDRLCQELEAIKLDTWQEYTLLKINSDVDEEPIYLLKMTCPSTGFIHVLRVPPNVESAKDAIIWVNWGIAPEEFAVQT